MNVERIRELLLERAIQGKLVPQLDSEPAVTQIGKAPEEVPFEIPEKWKWGKLFSVVPNVVDCPHSTPKYCSEDTGYLAIDTNCINQFGRIKQWRFVTKETYEIRINRLQPQENDIIYTREGSIGRAAILPKNVKVCMGQRVMLIRPGKAFNPSYLQSYLMCPAVLSYLLANQKGTTAKHINVSDVKDLLIPIPPLSEQRRIVARLNELLPLVDSYEKNEADLEQLSQLLKSAVLQKAIEGKLVPQLDSEPAVDQIGKAPEEVPFEIPEKWKWCLLEGVTKAISDGSHNPPPNTGSGIPVLSAKNVISGEIDFDSVNRWVNEDQWKIEDNKVHIEKRDVLLTIVGTIGRTALVETSQKFMLQRSVCVLKPEHLVVDASYLALLLSSPASLQWLEDRSAGTAQKGVYLKTVKKFPVPLPPLAEQRRIVARLKELFDLIDKHQRTAIQS